MKKAAKPVEEPHSITMTIGPVEIQMSWVPNAVGDLGMENTSYSAGYVIPVHWREDLWWPKPAAITAVWQGFGGRVADVFAPLFFSVVLTTPPQVLTLFSYTAILWPLLVFVNTLTAIFLRVATG